MTSYLLKFTRGRSWDVLHLDWLQEGEVQSDPITDLRTKEGKLSVWEIDADRTNLELVLLALACSRQNFDPLDFGLFDVGALGELGIGVEDKKGDSPVPRANKYHRDLTSLTISRLAGLIYAIFPVIDKDRKLPGQVRKLVLDAWTSDVDQDSIDHRLKQRIEEALSAP